MFGLEQQLDNFGMEDETRDESSKILCFHLPEKKQWIWLNTVLPSVFSFLLHISSLLTDCLVAFQLAWNDSLSTPALATLLFLYTPAVLTLALKPPKPPPVFSCQSYAAWFLKTMLQGGTFPITITVSLIHQVIWTVTVISNKKPHQETLHQYETLLSKEIHTYLFLQGFLHCCPQAILQIHLVLLKVTSNPCTEGLQVVSILVAVITVAKCAAMFHRYEAQVSGGRTPVLLLHTSEIKPTGPAVSMLPIPSCIRDDAAAMETDCFLAKVIAFSAWFFFIHSRILCLVIAKEIYPLTTLITVGIHILLMLSYQLASQPTSVFDLPSKILIAIFSTVALVEVSLRFHKVTLLYALFFISIFVEDTTLTILFFIYSSDICSGGILSCDSFGTFTYVIINSHVMGIMLFGIYLSRYQPGSKPMIPRQTTSGTS